MSVGSIFRISGAVDIDIQYFQVFNVGLVVNMGQAGASINELCVYGRDLCVLWLSKLWAKFCWSESDQALSVNVTAVSFDCDCRACFDIGLRCRAHSILALEGRIRIWFVAFVEEYGIRIL